MNVEFSNAYQEVLLENLDVILKQNFMMQTRLKLLEKEANVRAEMQAKIDELTVKHQEALEQIGQSKHYKLQAESNEAIVQEKTRIQSALNDAMRELSKAKSALEAKEKEAEEMKSKISELQKFAPKVIKKATVKSIEEKPVEISATETNKVRVEAGGTF
jgi:type I site-specific restriction endonuclease